MFGYRIEQWGQPLVWGEVGESVPDHDEVVIDVEACGVGRTVLNCIDGQLDDGRATLPRVPGHELVGRVAAVGDRTDEGLVGRRVVAYFYLFCGVCGPCMQGRQPHCERLEGWVGVHRDGGYAPMVVLPARNAVPIADSIDPVSATVVPDAVATPVHVSERANIGGDDRVVVIGAGGGVGAHMVQVARTRGASVAGFDTGAAKLECVERLGVKAVDSGDFSSLGSGRLFPGGPPTVVVDLIGTEDSTRWSLETLGMGGRLVELTTFRGSSQLFEPRRLVFRETSILGSRYATVSELREAARLVDLGEVEPVIGGVQGPADVLDLHDQLLSGDLVGRGALDWRER